MRVVRHDGRPPERYVVTLTPDEAKQLVTALTWIVYPGNGGAVDDLHHLLLAALEEPKR